MNIAQLFNPVERVVGISISQNAVRAVLLEQDKKGTKRLLSESTPLPPGTVQDGEIRDPKTLVATLREFREAHKNLFRSRYVILAVPHFPAFVDIIRLPQLAQEQIPETLTLMLQSRAVIPIAPEEFYYDWQLMPSHDPLFQDVLLGLAGKKHVDAYLKTLEEAGLHALAFETPHMATARAVANYAASTGLVVRLIEEGVELSVLEKGELRFGHFAPFTKTTHNLESFISFLEQEINKTLNFFEAEYHTKPSSAVFVSNLTQKQKMTEALAQKLGLRFENPKLSIPAEIDESFLPALGCAARGLIPREKDTLISLMPIGTEEAYRKRRFVSYVSLWSDIVNASTLLFLALFAGTLFLLTRTESNISTQTAHRTTTETVFPEIAKLEQQAAAFNETVQKLVVLDEKMPRWSNTLSQLTAVLAFPNITIHTISAPSATKSIAVSFTAATRNDAIEFKKALEAENYFEEVVMPFLSVTQLQAVTTTIKLTFKTQP